MSERLPSPAGDIFLVELPEDLKQCILSTLRQKKKGTSLEAFVIEVLEKHFSKELAQKKRKRALEESAPLDKYLPLDADPFEPVKVKSSSKLPLDFSEICQRSTSSGVPRFLK